MASPHLALLRHANPRLVANHTSLSQSTPSSSPTPPRSTLNSLPNLTSLSLPHPPHLPPAPHSSPDDLLSGQRFVCAFPHSNLQPAPPFVLSLHQPRLVPMPRLVPVSVSRFSRSAPSSSSGSGGGEVAVSHKEPPPGLHLTHSLASLIPRPRLSQRVQGELFGRSAESIQHIVSAESFRDGRI